MGTDPMSTVRVDRPKHRDYWLRQPIRSQTRLDRLLMVYLDAAWLPTLITINFGACLWTCHADDDDMKSLSTSLKVNCVSAQTQAHTVYLYLSLQ